MSIVRDDTTTDGLAIIDKYEAFVNYVYPILQNCPRRHGVVRDVVLALLFSPVGGLHHASKSRQVSRLYAVDAEFATLRAHLRFLCNIRVISPHQHQVALARLAEPGKMLGSWLGRIKNSEAGGFRKGQSGK